MTASIYPTVLLVIATERPDLGRYVLRQSLRHSRAAEPEPRLEVWSFAAGVRALPLRLQVGAVGSAAAVISGLN